MVTKDAAGSDRRQAETILLADDEPGIRRSMQRALEMKGYTVLTAGDGEDALAMFRAHRDEVDLLISDLAMPRLSGRELVQTLRAEGEKVRVLFSSGHADDAMNGTADLPDGVAFLQKPWTLEDLFSSVRAALDAAADGA
jgi:two-component system cell cycle sensor histidine kinase/response regulator CckA